MTDLVIPRSTDANFPRILRHSEKMDEALELFRDDPGTVADALALAAGILAGGGHFGSAAAVLIAQLSLFPDVDYSV